MFYTSYTFALLVISLFIFYPLFPQKYRWTVLLAGSFAFYAYAGFSLLMYIGMTIVSTYLAARFIGRLYEARDVRINGCEKETRKQIKIQTKAACRTGLLVCLALNIGFMAFVKLNTTLGFMRFAVPLGLSFYTFQSLSYIIDVYREKAKPEPNILKYALFVSFFPQIIQGPISRFNDLSITLFAGKALNARDLSFGGQRVLWGFFLKMVIADRLWPVWDTLRINTDTYAGAYVLVSIFFYAIILFCDFTGGIHITIGIAEMFGIKIKENFNRPFYSTNIAEYWRRWHMTMGAWFRDYVFYPLSVCKPMLRLSKKSRKTLGEAVGRRVPMYVCTLLTWFLTGIWHGATWNFIAWGLANGIVILISQEMQPLYARFHGVFPWGKTKFYHGFQIFRTFWLMCLIRSFDCYDGVGNTFRMWGSMVTRFDFAGFMQRGLLGFGVDFWGFVSAGLGIGVMLWVSFLGRGEIDARERIAAWRWPVRYAAMGMVFFMILVFGAYGIGYDARQFIYHVF
jgi:D-alanyl-lipoteichoic acid acyltransferase DltB (MBOAT superfamily)